MVTVRAIAVAISLIGALPVDAAELVSVGLGGVPGNSYSYYPSLSADGRFVGFASGATNLIVGDTNGTDDGFLRNREDGRTLRPTLSSSETQANGPSYLPLVSGSGRFVAFVSEASNLVSGDTNGVGDVFLRDRKPPQTTRRVSVSSAGVQGDGESGGFGSAISANGRWIAFASAASNLVPGDTNGEPDIFLHDAANGTTTRVSVATGGTQANGDSFLPALSANGRYIVFTSDASNLVANDANGALDIFLHDRTTQVTSRVSLGAGGVQANGMSHFGAISADARYVAFDSDATNLIPGGSSLRNVYARDRVTGKVTRLSVSLPGSRTEGGGSQPVISADGRYVAFQSDARNLVPGDTNGRTDIFVCDRQTGIITRVNLGPGGAQANDNSQNAAISANGAYVAFMSYATNLIPGGTPSPLSNTFIIRR